MNDVNVVIVPHKHTGEGRATTSSQREWYFHGYEQRMTRGQREERVIWYIEMRVDERESVKG